MSITLFFCYAREDEALLNKLKAHLRPLQREGLIDIWYDRNISAGSAWEQEIKQHLTTAQIVLLLVSPDFMNSDYCYGIEMKQALERHERGEAKVIPIILRPAYWHGKPLGLLKALPTDGKPVTDPEWYDLDRAFYNITEGISQVVKQLAAFPLPLVAEAMQSQRTRGKDTASPVQHGRMGALHASSLPPFEVKNLIALRTLTGHTGTIYSIAISPDGRMLISASEDHTIRMWDLSTGLQVQTLTDHANDVYSIAISPDRRMLISASGDNFFQAMGIRKRDHAIRVWDLSSVRQVHTLTGHTNDVYSVAISHNGKTLVSGSWDHTIRVWDLSTVQPVRTLTGHTGSVTSVVISPDGKMLISASHDKTIRVWNV